MGEVLGVLCGVAFFLGMIAVLGHGLWLAAAAIFQAISGTPPPKQSPPEDCLRCGTPLSPGILRCPICGLHSRSQSARSLRDLDALERLLPRLQQDGALDDTTRKQLADWAERRRHGLREPTPAVTARQPVPTPRPTDIATQPVLDVLPVEATAPPEPVPVAVAAPPVETPPEPAPPPAPRRTVAELLGAFMEERNILWGELIGGLLMVGCSVALVISLWKTLEQIPYFPFFIFAGITSALFGAGLYTFHYWKLSSTSRGLLAIAALLVPLNFLVLAGLFRQEYEAGSFDSLARIATGVAAALAFAGLLTLTGRVLVPTGQTLLALAVLGPAAALLLVPRFVLHMNAGPWLVGLLGAAPVGCHAGAAGLLLRRLRPPGEGDADVRQVLVLLGMSTFAVAVALGFLAYAEPDTLSALHRLAPLVALAGVPILLGGRFGQIRSTTAGIRATGTGVLVAGMAVLLVAVGLAWPAAGPVLLVCGLNFGVLTVLAFRGGLPLAHGAALPCAALGYLVAIHLLQPTADHLGHALFRPASGAYLIGVVAVFLGAAEVLVRRDRRGHGTAYALAAGGVGVASLLLVSLDGVDGRVLATAVHALYGFGVVAMTVRYPRSTLSHLGFGLLVAATVWWGGLLPETRPTWAAVVGLESLLLVLGAVAVARRWAALVATHQTALRNVAVAAGVVAFGLAVAGPGFPMATPHAWTAAALAGACLLLAWAYHQPWPTLLGSGLALAALAHLFAWDLGDGGPRHPWAVALVAHAVLVAVPSLVLPFRSRTSHAVRHLLLTPLRWTGYATSVFALPWLLAHIGSGNFTELAACLTLVATAWLVFALAEVSPNWFTASQVALAVAVLAAVTAWLQGQPWAADHFRQAIFEPPGLHAYGIGLALLALLGVGLRRLARGDSLLVRLVVPGRLGADVVLLAVVAVGQYLVAVGCALPGIVAEWTPTKRMIQLAPHDPADVSGLAAWALLGLLAAGAGLLPRRSWRNGAGALYALLGLTVPVLAALWFNPSRATASALRWGLAVAFLIASIPLWRRPTTRPVDWGYRAVLLGLSAVPVLLLTAGVAVLGFQGVRTRGPLAETLFAHMGALVSVLTPLVALTLGLSGHAVRERSAPFAFAAGLVAVAAFAGGNALAAVTSGITFGPPEAARLWLHVSLSASVWALLWHFAGPRLGVWRTDSGSEPDWILSLLQIALASGALLTAAVLAAGAIASLLPVARTFPEAVGGLLGWLAVGATGAAGYLWSRRAARRATVHVVCGVGLALVVVVASTVGDLDADPWPTAHVLADGWLLATALAAARVRSRWALHGWFMAGAGLVLLVSVHGGWDDPSRPYSTAGPVAVLALLAGVAAVRGRQPWFVYLSGALLTAAGTLGWLAWSEPDGRPAGLAYTVVLGLALASLGWSVAERLVPAGLTSVRLGSRLVAFRHAAASLALGLLAILVFFEVGSNLGGATLPAATALAWAAWAAVALAVAFTLPDAEAPLAPAGMYAVGLLGVGLLLRIAVRVPGDLLQAGDLVPRHLAWTALGLLAAYSLLAAVFARRLAKAAWFDLCQGTLGIVVVLLGLWAVITFDTPEARLMAPLALALITLTGLLQARGATGHRSAEWRYGTLALGVLLTAELGWALLVDTGQLAWLQRTAWAFIALAGWTPVYGAGFPRYLPAGPWSVAARRFGPILCILALLTLPPLLLLEGLQYSVEERRTPLDGPAVALVAAALVGLMAAALLFALRPGRDPLGLPESRRTAYVYGTELLLVLLFAHLRLTAPYLFRLVNLEYWTFTVMVIAYLGVGLSEVFARRGVRVLAEPLERTGLFLPLLPLLAFWLKPTPAAADAIAGPIPGARPFLAYLVNLPQHFDRYALLWFLMAGLYGWLAASRRSFGLALAAALAGNFGLWALFHHHDWHFLAHPQVWLIPPALILLIAEHLHRDQLPPAQAASMRYFGLSVLYLSSTADLLLTRLSVGMALVLAGLSVTGVLLGIVLRVRAFLFLGITFLALDVLAMIWHAAVDLSQPWVWWASGVALGAAILALFAVFEKRRNDVQRALEELRHWK